jgi:hypothetical protein
MYIIYSFATIYNLPLGHERCYRNVQNIFGKVLYLIDIVLVVPILGLLLTTLQCQNKSTSAVIEQTTGIPDPGSASFGAIQAQGSGMECFSSGHVVTCLVAVL